MFIEHFWCVGQTFRDQKGSAIDYSFCGQYVPVFITGMCFQISLFSAFIAFAIGKIPAHLAMSAFTLAAAPVGTCRRFGS